jgi:hypothetical protein
MEDKIPQKRTIKQVDREVVWKLATMMCTYAEIADVVGLGESTLKKRFGDLIEKGRSVGKKALRRAQFEKAISDKDPRMLIFLGKQYLSQKDNPENKDDDTPLPWQE